MNIRLMTIDDYEQVYAIWLDTPGLGLNNLDDTKESIAKYLKRNPGTSFVAEVDGRIVGAILSGNDGRRGYIHHTAVDARAQRGGIGGALVDAALAALKAEGINKVALTAWVSNEKGNAFWEKQGFFIREDLYYRDKELVELIYREH